MGDRTCREVLQEVIQQAGFLATALRRGPILAVEARSESDARPRFEVEVIPPGVLPEQACYREVAGLRIRYRPSPGASLTAEERGRMMGVLEVLAGRMTGGMALGLPEGTDLAVGLEIGTSSFVEVGGGRARELLLRVEFRCNQACPFCFVRLGPRRLSPADLPAVLGPWLRSHEDEVVLTGGEPTLHPGFLLLLEELRALGVSRVGLQTNGVRFADATLLRGAMERGLQRVLMSFHSHREDQYGRITRSRGQFLKAVQGLRNLAAAGPL